MANGPVEKRSCTDWPCCLLFIAFLAGMALCTLYGLTKGDPKLLLTTWDPDGNTTYHLLTLSIANGCGYSNKTKDYPYLYFPAPELSALASKNPLNAFKLSMCVKSCPKDDSTAIQCFVNSAMTNMSTKFSGCQYYSGISTTLGKKFRYDTQPSKLISY